MLGIPVLLTIFAGTWLFLFSLRPPPRLLGVYSRPGIWFPVKLVLFYLLLRIRRWAEDMSDGDNEDSNTESKVSSSTASSGAGVGSSPGEKAKKRPTPAMMECVQPLSDHPKAIDAVYFNSGNHTGHYLVAATARRPKGVINGVLYLRIPGVGLLQLPKMPDTLLFGDGEYFGAEGLRITPLEPMASWRIQYEGPMKMRGSPLSQHQVELDVTFISDQPYFHFDSDMDLWTMARCIAREPWSPKFFQTLQQAHQSHYEQMGRIEGTAVLDGHAHILRLHSMRDHSHGHKREWKLMHRYGMHMFTTEDGLQGNVGVICQPTVLSHLEMGYLCKDGQIEPVTKVDLLLWQHGENGHPPSDYAFSFTAGGKEYLLEVTVLEAPEFYIGWEWETRVVECMVSFRVNGRKGWGVAEWDYRHHGGRPHIYASHDPTWTDDLVKDCDDENGDISEDGLRCVVHYPELHLSKRTKVILLSEKSYSKLLQSKDIRSEMVGEECHFAQCQSVPVPSYNPDVEGYHRPCFLKFVKIARKESRSELLKENQQITNEGKGEPMEEIKEQHDKLNEEKQVVKDEIKIEPQKENNVQEERNEIIEVHCLKPRSRKGWPRTKHQKENHIQKRDEINELPQENDAQDKNETELPQENNVRRERHESSEEIPVDVHEKSDKINEMLQENQIQERNELPQENNVQDECDGILVDEQSEEINVKESDEIDEQSEENYVQNESNEIDEQSEEIYVQKEGDEIDEIPQESDVQKEDYEIDEQLEENDDQEESDETDELSEESDEVDEKPQEGDVQEESDEIFVIHLQEENDETDELPQENENQDESEEIDELSKENDSQEESEEIDELSEESYELNEQSEEIDVQEESDETDELSADNNDEIESDENDVQEESDENDVQEESDEIDEQPKENHVQEESEEIESDENDVQEESDETDEQPQENHIQKESEENYDQEESNKTDKRLQENHIQEEINDMEVLPQANHIQEEKNTNELPHENNVHEKRNDNLPKNYKTLKDETKSELPNGNHFVRKRSTGTLNSRFNGRRINGFRL